jgi:hypothetical protein
VDVTLTARTPVRELALLADVASLVAEVDFMLVTLMTGEHAVFVITTESQVAFGTVPRSTSSFTRVPVSSQVAASKLVRRRAATTSTDGPSIEPRRGTGRGKAFQYPSAGKTLRVSAFVQ